MLRATRRYAPFRAEGTRSPGTRFYLQPFPPPEPYRPAAGTHSAALPVGTPNVVAGDDQTLSTTIGQIENPFTFSTLAQTGHQDAFAGRFVAELSLAAQTIAANTWTFAFQADEADANANAFVALSLYVWRPGTASVAGYISDSDTALGTEWPVSRGPQVVTFAGGAVTTNNGDVLVLEVWQHATQAAAVSYALDFYYGGTQNVHSEITTDAASYLETPQVLSLSTSVASGGATFFLLNSLATPHPSANEKSVSLPFGTFSVTASGGIAEQRLMTLAPANNQVGIAWNGLGQTARQDGYLVRWSSPPLAAQALAAGTWTVGVAVSAGTTSATATAANSFVCVSLYIWRPSIAAVAGYLFDSTAALGTVWTFTQTGRVFTVNGNAFTILAGDLLVFEFWQTATQTSTAVQTHSLWYAGTTQPSQGVASANAASYLQAPQALTLQDFRPAGVLGPAGYLTPVRLRDLIDF